MKTVVVTVLRTIPGKPYVKGDVIALPEDVAKQWAEKKWVKIGKPVKKETKP